MNDLDIFNYNCSNNKSQNTTHKASGNDIIDSRISGSSTSLYLLIIIFPPQSTGLSIVDSLMIGNQWVFMPFPRANALGNWHKYCKFDIKIRTPKRDMLKRDQSWWWTNFFSKNLSIYLVQRILNETSALNLRSEASHIINIHGKNVTEVATNKVLARSLLDS